MAIKNNVELTGTEPQFYIFLKQKMLRKRKDQFSYQSQGKAMLKNVQTTAQLHSFHMLARSRSKSFKLGFSSMGTMNFQMYKLGLDNLEHYFASM